MSLGIPGYLDPLSVRAAIEGNLEDWYRLLVHVIPGAELFDDGDMLRTLTPIRHPLFNAVLRVNFAHGTTRRRVQDALSTLAESGLPGMWWIGPSTHPVDLASRLPAFGCVPTDTLVGMALDLRDRTWRIASRREMAVLSIKEARQASELVAWTLPFSEGFGMRGDILKHLAPLASLVDRTYASPQAGSEPTSACLRFFLATIDGVPVASAMLFVAGGVAGLYGVATRTRHRNRGYATEVVRAALRAAEEEGCRVCILHATPMALSVYRRLGFVEYCRLRTLTYYPPAADAVGDVAHS